MGTRADFYVGRGEKAEWLGSVAMDGYPDGKWADYVVKCATADSFRAAVEKMLGECEHGTKPERGWPWPWEDSRTTDFSYAFDDGKVWASCFGYEWFDPTIAVEDEDGNNYTKGEKVAIFPNMKTRQNVTMGPRSGLLVIQG